MDFFAKHSNKFWRFALVLGFAFVFSCCGLIAEDQKAEEKKFNEELKKSINDTASSVEDKKEFNTDPKAKGEYGEMERFAKEFLNKAISIQKSYQSRFNAIGFKNFLSIERLKQDPDLEKSKTMLRDAKALLVQYKSQRDFLFKNIRKDIEKLNMSSKMKQDLALGLEKGIAMASGRSEEIWKLRNNAMSECEKFIIFLDSKRGTWDIKGSQIVFKNDSDIKIFDSYIMKLQELGKMEKALQQQNVDAAKKMVNEL